jgi:hypothetical protein
VSTQGVITLVECKLAANPEIRRSIVGQALAYASGVWRMTMQEFTAAWQSSTKKTLQDAIREALSPDVPFDEAEFVATVSANLASGRLRLILAVDRITDELRRIIEFLNDRTVSDFEVAALELHYVADGGTEILVPSVFGLEIAQQKAAAPANKTTEDALLKAVDAWCSLEVAAALRHIYTHASAHSRFTGFYYGDGK